MRFSLRARRDATAPRVAFRRDGMTLVVIAICTTMLFGIAALATDAARMYRDLAQLKVLTDAAALSALTDLKKPGVLEVDAQTRVLALRAANQVNGTTLTDAGMGRADIQPGQWSVSTRSFVSAPWSSATAVRVTARYDAAWTIARLFGVTSKRLTQTSTAALASTVTNTCFKPWGVPYSNLLTSLGRAATDTAYRLTTADVTLLRTNRVPIAFKVSSKTADQGGATVGGVAVPGNYYAVRYPPVQYANGTSGSAGGGGGSAYRDAIADTTCALAGTASVGDWLDLESGAMTGPTQQGMQALCGKSGGTFACDRQVYVPIWSVRNGASNSAWVQILYVGAFRVTQYSSGTVTGYLTAMASSTVGGGVTTTPGPVATAALFQ